MTAIQKVDPVGFEPTIFSLQRRRLPARPRARNLAEPWCRREDSNLHTLAVIDPKSIASANSATSASPPLTLESIPHRSCLCKFRATLYPRFCPQTLELLRNVCSAVICLTSLLSTMWRFVACQVLPDLTRTAAARFSQPCDRRTHLPCSRLHARPADDIAAAAGGLLPHRFTPYQAHSQRRRDSSLLRL